MQSRVWHGHCSLAVLAVLLAVLIVRLQVEMEMAGHDPYCYWDASFPSVGHLCAQALLERGNAYFIKAFNS